MNTTIILQSMYILVPAYLANMAPVISKRLRFLDFLAMPVDRGKELNGRQIFGSHKTWRGLVMGTLAGILGAYLQFLLQPLPFWSSVSVLDYSNWLGIGALLGSGAMLGDLIKSFFKRRVNVEAGAKFIPFDQLDFVLGAYLFILPISSGLLSLALFLSSLIASFFLHILTNHLAYYLKIRKERW